MSPHRDEPAAGPRLVGKPELALCLSLLIQITALSCLAFVLAASSPAAAASSTLECLPRESFPGFVARFKQDADFRVSRIVFPLSVAGGLAFKLPERVARSDYRDLQSFPLVTPQREAELAGGEGELCESTRSSADSRVFFQHSCETDVYGHVYHFERRQGCWLLVRVELGGS